MKRKIFLGIFVTAIVAVAVLNINFGLRGESLSDLTLANMEALARGESSGNNGKSLAQKANGDYCCATNAGNNCTQSPGC